MGVERALELPQFIKGDSCPGTGQCQSENQVGTCLLFHGPADKYVLFVLLFYIFKWWICLSCFVDELGTKQRGLPHATKHPPLNSTDRLKYFSVCFLF